MSKLLKLIKAYLSRPMSQKDREDTYLNQSVDICDLERRMRAIDKRSNQFSTHNLIVGMEGR